MNAMARTAPPDPAAAPVVGFLRPFIERALKDRVRYRYVQPRVLQEGEGFRIEAPCCSRNVDPEGGVIDIALLTPSADGRWRLQARDHAAGVWEICAEGLLLGEALDILCVDAQRRFWP
ncbi:MAG: hypothetical protein LWW96_17985 [Acidovorax sp.]|uniref:DUF3024 domain-containing protein n=1 Tax=Acidovorax sp. TaxID=1872122 RepID=UPI0025C4C25F|nr:hypothetical protein [Acidovorax sp.]MCE1194041.1 hypothetical protein [Acidovorax sp.]